MSFEKNYCSDFNKGLRKYKDIIDFLKIKSIPERERIIIDIQATDLFNKFMEDYENSEVVKNNK